MSAEPLSAARRHSRAGLYAPFVVLALLAIGWSVAWFVIRGRVVDGLDGWVAAEASAGRRWTCPDRGVAGFPFRIEIRCPTLGLERPDVTATLGPLLVVAQVYRPGHIIAETPGPLAVQAGADRLDATWSLLQVSVVTTAGQERAALVADAPRLRVESAATGPLDLPARRLEAHLRPDPANPRTADVALSATGAAIPGLDAAIGGTEPADLEIVATVSQAYDLPARPLPSELERWRVAGGEVTFARIDLAKGPRRIRATGTLAIDEAHRPLARLDAAATGIEGLLGRVVGDKAAGGLLGALLGAAARPAAPADAGLKPLPPLRIDSGRLLVGPIAVPGIRIPALY